MSFASYSALSALRRQGDVVIVFRMLALAIVFVDWKESRMSEKPARDIEVVYSVKDFVAKLRRLADALEQEKPFTIQVANERFTVPAGSYMSVEHERTEDGEELEFQLKWKRR